MSETTVTTEPSGPVGDVTPAVPSTSPTDPVGVAPSAPVEPDALTTPAPIEYGEFVIPEGMRYDPELNTAFSTKANELGLSKEQAQGLVDLGAQMQSKALAAQQEHVATVAAQWEAEAKADKEFGGENFEANLAVAKLALDHVASPALVDQLNSTGLGSHPDMIRALYRMGLLLKEDGQIDSGRHTGSGTTSIAQTLYPNMNP